MHGWDNNWGGGQWMVMALMMLLFWGGLVALVIAVLHRPGGSSWHDLRPAHHDAERILAERFARGEIDDDEYHKRLAALRKSS